MTSLFLKFSWMAASQRQLQTYIFLRNSKSVFTWDFISGEIKYFHFGILSIPKRNSSQVLFHFFSGDKICKYYPKWNHMKGNICTCVNKTDWTLLNGPFISDQPQNKIHFISPAMKSNVNRTCFMVGWNFVSGRFHFGSHVNNLQVTHILHFLLWRHVKEERIFMGFY